MVCPFHGHRIRLAATGDPAAGTGPGFAVPEVPSVHAARGLFVRLGDGAETGLIARLRELERTHHIVPAFDREVAVPGDYVIENAFDLDHFASVHGLSARPELAAHDGPAGTLDIAGEFRMHRANQWQGGAGEDDSGGGGSGEEGIASAHAASGGVRTCFAARVYSPLVVVSQLGPPEAPNVVITSANPAGPGRCVARVTVALPRERVGGKARVRDVASLVSGSRTAFEQDAQVWEHLDTAAPVRYVPGDAAVIRFREFCAAFAGPP